MSVLRTAVELIKRNWTWLKWPVALFLLAYLFYSSRAQIAKLRAQSISWVDFGTAIVLCGTSILLTFYRWYLLVWAQDFPFKLRDAMRLGFIGIACNYVAPGSAGGDLVKAAMIAAEQQSRRLVAAATVLVDRILGMQALLIVGALATFFQNPRLLENPLVKVYLAVIWGGTIGGLIGLAIILHPAVPRSRLMQRLVALPKVGRMIGELVNAVLLYQSRRAILALAVLISVPGHFGMLSTFYFCSKALRAGPAAPTYAAHLFLIPGAEVGGVFVPTPAGMGGLEGLVAWCYGINDEALENPVPKADAEGAGLLTAVAYRAITLLVAAIGVGYYLTSRGEIAQALAEAKPAGPVRVE